MSPEFSSEPVKPGSFEAALPRRIEGAARRSAEAQAKLQTARREAALAKTELQTELAELAGTVAVVSGRAISELQGKDVIDALEEDGVDFVHARVYVEMPFLSPDDEATIYASGNVGDRQSFMRIDEIHSIEEKHQATSV